MPERPIIFFFFFFFFFGDNHQSITMAEADEDAAHLPNSHESAGQIETDLSDETQDFRLLNNLSLQVIFQE